MNHYKVLNKELVEQVQTMRIRLQEYSEEIISLRATCMHKHENIVFLRKKCRDFALLHFQQYLEFLEPNSTMLAVIKEFHQDAISTTSQILENGRMNGNVRQSSRLAGECRRSSSLTQSRRSFNSTSPIRSTRCSDVQLVEDDVLESEFESSIVLIRNAILEEDEHFVEEDEIVNTRDSDTTEETVSCLNTTNALFRGEDEEFDTETNNDIHTVERRTRTFRDITNTLCTANTLHKTTVHGIKKTSNEHKTRRKETLVSRGKTTESSIDHQENGNANIISPTVSSSPVRKTNHVTVSRGKCERKKHSDKHCSPEENEREIAYKLLSKRQIWLAGQRSAAFGDLHGSLLLQDSNTEVSQQESIDEVRDMTKETHKHDQPGEEVTDSSYAISENTLSQFKEATSSTPIQQLRNITPSSTPGHSTRPKRSCVPKTMVEPSQKAKMRNESGEKSLGYRKGAHNSSNRVKNMTKL